MVQRMQKKQINNNFLTWSSHERISNGLHPWDNHNFNHCIGKLDSQTIIFNPAWEIVPTPSSTSDIIRTRVPNGWLVTYRAYLARGLVYIPDDKHEWKVK